MRLLSCRGRERGEAADGLERGAARGECLLTRRNPWAARRGTLSRLQLLLVRHRDGRRGKPVLRRDLLLQAFETQSMMLGQVPAYRCRLRAPFQGAGGQAPPQVGAERWPSGLVGV